MAQADRRRQVRRFGGRAGGAAGRRNHAVQKSIAPALRRNEMKRRASSPAFTVAASGSSIFMRARWNICDDLHLRFGAQRTFSAKAARGCGHAPQASRPHRRADVIAGRNRGRIAQSDAPAVMRDDERLRFWREIFDFRALRRYRHETVAQESEPRPRIDHIALGEIIHRGGVSDLRCDPGERLKRRRSLVKRALDACRRDGGARRGLRRNLKKNRATAAIRIAFCHPVPPYVPRRAGQLKQNAGASRSPPFLTRKYLKAPSVHEDGARASNA